MVYACCLKLYQREWNRVKIHFTILEFLQTIDLYRIMTLVFESETELWSVFPYLVSWVYITPGNRSTVYHWGRQKQWPLKIRERGICKVRAQLALGKGLSPYQTRLHTFSHQFNLFRLYSVEANRQPVEALWQTLSCAQVETGIPYVR